MATAAQEAFLLAAVDLDGVDVGRTDDGQLTAARDLADDQVELDDLLDLAAEHGLRARNVVTDMQHGETRVVFDGGEDA